MDYSYNQKYGITFYFVDLLGDLYAQSTWDDYKLIPKGRPFVAPPALKTVYMDIPGMDGKLDFTEALMGRPAFANRSGSWTFINSCENDPYDTFLILKRELDGRLMNVVLNGNPDYFYRGRVQLSNITANADSSGTEFTIDYNLNPYKYSTSIMTPPTSPIVSANYSLKSVNRSLSLSGETEEISIENKGPNTMGSVYCSGSDMSATVDDVTYPLSVGNNKNIFTINSGYNNISFNGNGRVQLYYAEGRL